MKAKTEYEVVLACENDLGWMAPRGVQLWKARGAEVRKLKSAMAKAGVSIADVMFALELSKREHNHISAPMDLVYRVERARERAVETAPVVAVDQQIQDAIDFEMDQELPGWEQWVSRLTRCAGRARVEVFEEWTSKRLAEAA